MKFWDKILKKPKITSIIVVVFWIVLISVNFNKILNVSDYVNEESSNLSTSGRPDSILGKNLIAELSDVNGTFQLVLHNPNGSILTEESRDTIRTIINNITFNTKIGPFLSPKQPYRSLFDDADNLLRSIFALQWYATQLSFASIHYLWGGINYYVNDWLVTYNITGNVFTSSVITLEHTKNYIESLLSNNNESLYFERAEVFLQEFSSNFELEANLTIPSTYEEGLNISKEIVAENQTIFSNYAEDQRELLLLTTISSDFNSSKWDDNDYGFQEITRFLFETNDSSSTNFVKEVYADGNIEGFVEAKNKYLLPVLRKEVILPPLTESIIDTFLKQYTNFNGENNTINSTIVLFNMALEYNSDDGRSAYLELLRIIPLMQETFQPIVLYITGIDLFLIELSTDYETQLKKTDIIVIITIIIILLLVYRSPVLPLIQIFVLLISFGVSRLIFITFEIQIGGLSTTSLIILSVTLLGSVTDYCVFIMGDYLLSLKEVENKMDAIKRTLKRTSKSIVISAISLSFGFGALILSRFNMATGIGIGGTIGFLTGLIVSLTLLPAILILIDSKYLTKWKIQIKKIKKPKFSIIKYIKKAVNNPKKTLFIFLIISGLGIGIFFLIPTDYAQISSAPMSYETRQGVDAVINYLGPEYISQIVIVFQTPLDEAFLYSNNSLNFQSINEVLLISEGIFKEANLSQIVGLSHPLGIPYPESLQNTSLFVKEEIHTLMKNFILSDSSVSRVILGSQYPEGNLKLDEQVVIIRDRIESLMKERGLDDWNIYVSGYVPEIYDAKVDIRHDFNLIFAFASLAITFLLFLFLRDFFMSIRVLITILLSLGIGLGVFGILTLLFLGGSIYWLVPLMSYAVLTALGMDFDVLFLGIFIDIYEDKKKTKEAIIEAVSQTMNNISIAGIIMAATYLSLLFTSSIHMQQLGLGLGVGILIDVFISRLFIVPPAVVLSSKKQIFRKKKEKKNEN